MPDYKVLYKTRRELEPVFGKEFTTETSRKRRRTIVVGEDGYKVATHHHPKNLRKSREAAHKYVNGIIAGYADPGFDVEAFYTFAESLPGGTEMLGIIDLRLRLQEDSARLLEEQNGHIKLIPIVEYRDLRKGKK